MRVSRNGFTLVELLSAVAIAGILAAIAIPNYRKYQMRARQAEAKVSLGAVYLTELGAMQDQHSFTSCFGQLGGQPPGLEYYAVGFANAVARGDLCSPYGAGALKAGVANNSCLNFAWVRDSAGVSNVSQSCNDNPGETYFAAVAGNLAGSSAAADLVDLAGGALNWNSFRIRAAGHLGYKEADLWEIDENKSVYQVKSGLGD